MMKTKRASFLTCMLAIVFAMLTFAACSPTTYSVTFLDHDGSTLYTASVEEGKTITFGEEDPTKASDDFGVYTFVGWKDEGGFVYTTLPIATQNQTFTAVYRNDAVMHTVTFLGTSGETLSTVTYAQGAVPTAPTATPVKPEDEAYTYVFAGWTDGESTVAPTEQIPQVTTSVTYSPVFTPVEKTFAITFKDGDGNTILTKDVAYGSVPAFDGTLPEKESTAEYEYAFSGWTAQDGTFYAVGDVLPVVKGEASYVVNFSRTKKSYAIKWIVNGTEYTDSVAYGTMPNFGNDPEIEATTDKEYRFMGWSITENGTVEELSAVTGAKTYYAVFEENVRSYEITWIVEGAAVREQVAYGEIPVYNGGSNPTKLTNASTVFAFAGWATTEDGAVSTVPAVTGNATYYCVFNESARPYTVTWYDGTSYSTTTVGYGSAPVNTVIPTRPSDEHSSYSFAGWAKTPDGTAVTLASERVTGDTFYVAKWNTAGVTETAGKLTINYAFRDDNNDPSDDPTLPEPKVITGSYGDVISETATATPALAGYLPDYFHLAGTLKANEVVTVTYSKASAWDGTYPDKTSANPMTGSGTEADPYLIASASDLAWLSSVSYGLASGAVYGTGEHYKLTTSIDLDNQVFNPLGGRNTGSTQYATFKGTIDGNGYTIAGFKWTDEAIIGIALVTKMQGSIKNLTMQGATKSKNRSAGFVYWLEVGTVENCINFVDVTTVTGEYTAGIVGTLSVGNSAINCVNYGSITATSGARVGGIVGNGDTVIIKNNINYGTVTQTASSHANDLNCGGIAGYAKGTSELKDCINFGNVVSTDTAKSKIGLGGILGWQSGGGVAVNDCKNYGDVDAGIGIKVAGITGYTSGPIKNCVNFGNITGSSRTGGISGEQNHLTIEQVANYGNITSVSGDSVGGICGWSKATLVGASNFGNVVGVTKAVGGIYGWASGTGADVIDCRNHGTVTATGSQIGGIVGYGSGDLSGCLNTGAVVGGSTVGGIIGFFNDAEGASGLTIRECTNLASVTGSANYVGGIAGNASYGDAYNCKNFGAIQTGGDYIGGILGASTSSIVRTCENFGDISNTTPTTAGTSVAGIIGHATYSTDVADCINYGDIAGKSQVGGILGYAGGGVLFDNTTDGATTRCVNFGTVTGVSATTGNLIGRYNRTGNDAPVN